ncbi:uncharacterized protein LOC143608187, partial [Bidens hawaiensis]|uniref:uncharacterized protein LOC143608187 n=1 Tax=Bidens hawaiensis TaxID=980011 RepID=UPI00404B1741
MLAKWWWRFKEEKNGLWRKVVWSIHHTARSWNFIPVRKSLAGSWRNIIAISDKLEEMGICMKMNLKYELGNGQCSLFWIDKWIGEEPLQVRFPRLFALERSKMCVVADRLMMYENELCGVWNWVRQLTREMEIEDFRSLLNLCEGVHMGSNRDRLLWGLNEHVGFTVKSVKDKLGEIGYSRSDFAFMWNAWVPKSLAQDVWQIVSMWCGLPSVYAFSVRDLLDLHRYAGFGRKKAKVFYAVCLVTLWSIWKAMNELVFKE